MGRGGRRKSGFNMMIKGQSGVKQDANARVRERLPMCRVDSLGREDLEPMNTTSVLEELSYCASKFTQ